MAGLILYGTGQDAAVRAAIAGQDLATKAAVLPGQGAVRAPHSERATLAAGPGAAALWCDVSGETLARFDHYEAAFGFARQQVAAVVEGAPCQAWAYCGPAGAAAPPPWSFAEWQLTWAPLTAVAAAEAMALYGRLTSQALAAALPTMRMRAAARLRAEADPAPIVRRLPVDSGQIALLDDSQPYTDYFAVRQTRLSHPKFDGSASGPLLRSAWLAGDAVTILPYDPKRDRVLLVEQFRFGAFARGDRFPWCLEPIAGRIDPGETPEEAGRREAAEEAGLVLSRLLPIANYYPSPGSVTEYLYSYVGLADLPDTAAGLGGLEAEDEDIRAHVLSFAELESLIAEGEVDNAPLLISALWLAPRRRSLG